jgi:amidase
MFLETGAKLGAAALALPSVFVSVSAAASRVASQAAAAAQPPFELEEVEVGVLQLRMKAGELTARSLAEKYLARIDALDKRGPGVNAVIELNPDALSIADSLDAERKSKGVRGRLHGIPVLLKDNIGTADRMSTTAGSLALVILGKTNLSEWANFRSSHASSGWSGRGGQTRNPYALDRNPCGSSSGSGAGVSANFCSVAVGTETDGSIVCPASANGVVGIKPTLGLVSRAGIIPIAHSQDTAGPLCRTVADAAALLGAMAGEDSADPATAGAGGKIASDYTQFLDVNGLRGARIGVVRKAFDPAENVARVFDEAIAAMKHEGAVIVDPVEIASLGKFDDSELAVLMYEFKTDLDAYLAAAGPRAIVHSLKDVIEFNNKNESREMAYFGQDILEKSQAKGPLTDKAYLDALAKNHRLTREEGIDTALAKYKLDALVAPTAGPSWLIDLIDGDHDTGGSSSLAAVAGYPAIAVPAGFVFGLPVGISFFGAAWSEPKLLRIAYAFEQATKVRKPPRFLPTAPLAPTRKSAPPAR